MIDYALSQLPLLIEWAVSPAVMAFLQWLGTLIAVVGIPWSVRRSSQAAKSAKEAAIAVAQFQSRSRSVSVAHSYSHLELAKGFVSAQNFPAALTVVGILKRDVLLTTTLLEKAAKPPPNLMDARRNIKAIEVLVNKASRADPTFKINTLERAISGLSDCLIDWEDRFVTSVDRENQNAIT